MDAPVIEVHDLHAGYGNGLILQRVNARFMPGRITCVVGGSGCGKSTLLRSIIGLLPPRQGHVRVLGEDPYAVDEDARARLLARVGFLFQNGALLNSLTVAENLAIPLRAHTRLPADVCAQIIAQKLALVGLAGTERLLPGELSGGMKKRVGLARALILDPPVVLCDEPSAGLDPVTAAQLDDLLVRARRLLGTTMIVVTHELPSIHTIADDVVMLADGGVRFAGPLADATASDDRHLRAFFGRESAPLGDPPPTLYDALRVDARGAA
ncbi:MAG: ATP-binding cassette domain-containing protein [Deltaproteobacteria bacterium]|nr:MAG: ATP-binding cassette domain-containing protein [Deltaproteobacteria bacterium]